ncbi:hypothetical protein [Microbacterium sp. CFBP9034]|uniref:hypothetical protein n=1 Tax=Microbacterium sp. CFBP9034 TaxID=3096540 RepID=UPI002A6AABAF|nr:hypothetical protein [Microbacterium sp. CFBP9034]MDY0910324.1 hypothetical protein [Microbacterium sp. CFBP9034]
MSFPGYGLVSPEAHYPLGPLEGDPEAIEAAGRTYESIGAQMTSTADELARLGNNEKYKAESLDAIRESARELQADLHKVAERYEKTGPVLVTYASALRLAQRTTVNPYVPRIQAAHTAHQEAVEARRQAENDADDLDRTWPWEDEATDAEKRVAAQALSGAESAESSAEGTLTSLWESFESGYGVWDTAYEAAVSGVQSALDASGINDSWWEDALDGLADVAAFIGAIAIVVALVVTGPIAAIALVIATVVAIVALVAHLTMAFAGSRRVSGWDILFDVVGVVPFLGAFGKALKGGQGALGSLRIASGAATASGSTLAAGRNAVALDMRAISSAGRGGNRAAREALAPGIADNFLSGVNGSWARGTWNAIRGGGGRVDGQVWTMSERMAGAWPGAGTAGMRSQNWMQLNGAMPGPVFQGANVWNAAYGNYDGVLQPIIPGAPDLQDHLPNVDFLIGR